MALASLFPHLHFCLILVSRKAICSAFSFQMQVKVDELMLVGLFAKFVSHVFNLHTESPFLEGVSRAKIAVPPGFSAPSRVPPPGFSSQTRFNQTYDGAYSGENHYQSHSVSHSGDVEFIDPAILAVGKSRIPVEPNSSTLGLKSSFPARFVTSDNDPRFQLLSQQMISSHQNTRIPDMEETFWPLNDAFAASRLLAQSHTRFSPLAQLSHQQPRNPLYSNSHWDAWNNFRTAADMGMGEVFRNERIGLNDYYKSTPENKFHMPSASDLYSRAFGM